MYNCQGVNRRNVMIDISTIVKSINKEADEVVELSLSTFESK